MLSREQTGECVTLLTLSRGQTGECIALFTFTFEIILTRSLTFARTATCPVVLAPSPAPLAHVPVIPPHVPEAYPVRQLLSRSILPGARPPSAVALDRPSRHARSARRSGSTSQSMSVPTARIRSPPSSSSTLPPLRSVSTHDLHALGTVTTALAASVARRRVSLPPCPGAAAVPRFPTVTPILSPSTVRGLCKTLTPAASSPRGEMR